MEKDTVMRSRRVVALLLALGALLVLSACSDSALTSSSEEPSASELTSGASEDASSAEASPSADAYIADIVIDGYGTITVELDSDAAPITVENFVKLANEGFYNGLTFHRIIDGFMMQGGDPTGTGTGGSDETIVGEFSENGYDNPISHVRGVISMARSTDPNSASSQFFIVDEDSTFLDGSYAGFGHVTDGMDVVDAVTAAAQPVDGNGMIASDAQPVITSITIRGAGSAADSSGTSAAPDASADAAADDPVTTEGTITEESAAA